MFLMAYSIKWYVFQLIRGQLCLKRLNVERFYGIVKHSESTTKG